MAVNRLRLSTTPGFWIVLSFLFLVLPLPWLLAILISSAAHELSHLAAAAVLGVRIRGIDFRTDGLRIETEPMTPVNTLLCALAGPIGALVLLLFARWMPRTAVCAAVQSLYHLLPVFPLDGGRALHSAAELIPICNKGTFCSVTESIVSILLAVTGLYFSFILKLGFLPVIISVLIVFRICQEKSLANSSGKGYNRCTNS